MVLKMIHAGFEEKVKLIPCLSHNQLMVAGLLELPLADGMGTISLAGIQLYFRQGHKKQDWNTPALFPLLQ